MNNNIETKKEKLFHRDQARCQCCSKKLTLHSMTLGHRVPKAISKTEQIENLQLECFKCNANKSKLNKQYLRNERRFKKNGGKLIVSVHSVTYDRVKKEGNLDWFEKNNFVLQSNNDVMIGDFAILEQEK